MADDLRPNAESDVAPWCAQVAQTIVPCPSACKENAWHHHHNQQGMLWTNPGATCPGARPEGVRRSS